MDEKSGGSKKVQRIEVIDSFPLEKGEKYVSVDSRMAVRTCGRQ